MSSTDSRLYSFVFVSIACWIVAIAPAFGQSLRLHPADARIERRCEVPDGGEPPSPSNILRVGFADGGQGNLVVPIPTNPLRNRNNGSSAATTPNATPAHKMADNQTNGLESPKAKNPVSPLSPLRSGAESPNPSQRASATNATDPTRKTNRPDIAADRKIGSDEAGSKERETKEAQRSANEPERMDADALGSPAIDDLATAPDLNAAKGTEPPENEPSEDEPSEERQEDSANENADSNQESDGDSNEEESEENSDETETSKSTKDPVEETDSTSRDEDEKDSAISSKARKSNNQIGQEAPELDKANVSPSEAAEEEKKEAESAVRNMKTPVAEVKTSKKVIRDVSPPVSKNNTPNNPSPSYPGPGIPLTQPQKQLKNRLESCLAYYLFRPESVAKRSPWAVMHAMLPYGVEAELIAGNQRVNAIGWMCYNGKCRTQRLFKHQGNSFTMEVGPGVQGHEGQLLAMLAQSYVPSTYPIQLDSQSFTVGDLIHYEMAGCKEKSELTFKLIGLSHYLPSDKTWQTSDRKIWSISKLVEEELSQPIVGAACGGTHRLMGLTYAVQRREEQGLPIEDNFFRAKKFVTDFVDYAFTLQNPDGSFSTDWFERRANESDLDRKVQTTGHILEWLIYTLPENRLSDPRITKAVNFLLSQLLDRRDHDWAIGPRGHSLRALALYDQKVFGAQPGQRKEQLAGHLKQIPIRR